jgi:predicted phosphodiesterase
MDEVPTTLILRFRDLGRSPGFTIEQHLAVIREHQSVWWGWWSKAGEQPPADSLTTLAARCADGGVELYLYDSGSLTLYQATCSQMEFGSPDARLVSPRPELTPEYYRGESFQAWFRLSSIVEASPTVLSELVYARVDSFFDTGRSRFGRFYGTRIRFEDLLDQNRSIWFARPARPNSRKTPRKASTPSFPLDFATTTSTRVLWLSDLHFSRDAHEHEFPLEQEPARQPLWSAVQRVVRERTGSDDLGAIIVSGDLTFRADPTEFEHARVCIDELLGRAALEASHAIVVPGNHDLAFTSEPWKKKAPVKYSSATARRAYEDFYDQLYGYRPNSHLSLGSRLLLGGAVPVEVLGLNSSALQQKAAQFQGHGFLGQLQLDDAAEQMGWTRKPPKVRAYRMVVLHHHVVPITHRIDPKADDRYSVVLDAGAFMTWLADHKVDLVLHGHEHQPGVATVTKLDSEGSPHEFTVVGLGSAGVAAAKVGDVKHNVFGVLDFSNGAPPSLQIFTVNPGGEGHRLPPDYPIPVGGTGEY